MPFLLTLIDGSTQFKLMSTKSSGDMARCVRQSLHSFLPPYFIPRRLTSLRSRWERANETWKRTRTGRTMGQLFADMFGQHRQSDTRAKFLRSESDLKSGNRVKKCLSEGTFPGKVSRRPSHAANWAAGGREWTGR